MIRECHTIGERINLLNQSVRHSTNLPFNHANNPPKVSVIMNCFNGEKYLREAINSVYAQTYTDWEIVFWDNASTDNSVEIAKSYDDRLRYFLGEKTVPLYTARNYALKQARGEYIAILDCDDIWLPAKLEEQLPLFEKDGKIGLVYSDSFLFNEKGKEKRLFKIKKPCRGYVFSQLLLDLFIHIPTVVIKKEAFNSLDHWFDSRLNMIGDWDVYLRLSYRWKADYVDRVLVKYRVHRNSTSFKEGRKLLTFEYDLMIENIKKTISDFESKYPEEVKLLKRRRDVQLSLLDWENGDKKRARSRLRVYKNDGIVFLVLHFLMYLPYKYVFYLCYRMYSKNLMAN